MFNIVATLFWVLLAQAQAREWPWSDAKSKTALELSYKPSSEVAWVGTLNGELHALNTRTGTVLWSADVGGTTIRSFQAVDSLDVGVVVPGADGSVFVHSQGELKRFPLTVPDFVEQSPMFQVLPNGRKLTIVGSKSDRVFQLDKVTGRVIKSFSSDESGSFTTGENMPAADQTMSGGNNVLLVKRHDYRVRAFDEESGKEVWNFTYGVIDPAAAKGDHVGTSNLLVDSQARSLLAQVQGVWKHPYPVASAAFALDDQAVVVAKPSIVPFATGQVVSAIVKRMVLDDGAVQLYVGPSSPIRESVQELEAPPSSSDDVLPYPDSSSSKAVMLVPDGGITEPIDDTCAISLGEHKVVPYAPEDMGTFPNLTRPARTTPPDESALDPRIAAATFMFALGMIVTLSALYRQRVAQSSKQKAIEMSEALSSSPSTASEPLPGSTGKATELSPAADAMEPESAKRNEDGSHRIGKLTVHMARVKGYGGNGTIVVEGRFEERPVAVKRMQRALLNSASKEIDFLIQSEGHSNVVRYLAKEETSDFIYLALELCEMTLDQAIELQYQDRKGAAPKPWVSDDTRLFLHELASATNHLHANGIVHCDIKPQNVLVVPRPGKPGDVDDFGSRWVAKLSDMGLSRTVDVEQSSFHLKSHQGTQDTKSHHMGAGTVGWRAPELLVRSRDKKARLSRKVDVFSLGCVFFYVLLQGDHPFGESLHRESHIVQGEAVSLDKLAAAYAELRHLVGEMIAYDPTKRPSMAAVLFHPFLWTAKSRLDFLCDVSNRLEKVDPASGMLKDLETRGKRVFSPALGWAARLESTLERDVTASKHRKYDVVSYRDLLRYIRNKRHHFDEDPELSRVLSWEPESFLQTFCASFPELVVQAFEWAVVYCGTEAKFLEVCGGVEVVTERSERVPKLASDEPAMSSSCRRIRRQKDRDWFVCDWVNDFPDMPPLQMPPSHNHKSMLCAHWERSGGQFCVMGSKCGFAHGPVELRLLPQQLGQPDSHFTMRPPPPSVNRTPNNNNKGPPRVNLANPSAFSRNGFNGPAANRGRAMGGGSPFG